MTKETKNTVNTTYKVSDNENRQKKNGNKEGENPDDPFIDLNDDDNEPDEKLDDDNEPDEKLDDENETIENNEQEEQEVEEENKVDGKNDEEYHFDLNRIDNINLDAQTFDIPKKTLKTLKTPDASGASKDASKENVEEKLPLPPISINTDIKKKIDLKQVKKEHFYPNDVVQKIVNGLARKGANKFTTLLVGTNFLEEEKKLKLLFGACFTLVNAEKLATKIICALVNKHFTVNYSASLIKSNDEKLKRRALLEKYFTVVTESNKNTTKTTAKYGKFSRKTNLTLEEAKKLREELSKEKLGSKKQGNVGLGDMLNVVVNVWEKREEELKKTLLDAYKDAGEKIGESLESMKNDANQFDKVMKTLEENKKTIDDNVNGLEEVLQKIENESGKNVGDIKKITQLVRNSNKTIQNSVSDSQQKTQDTQKLIDNLRNFMTQLKFRVQDKDEYLLIFGPKVFGNTA